MSGFTIRDATHADVDEIARLESEAFPCPWKAAFFDSELRAPARYNRVAVDAGDAVIGYVFAMYYFDEMHINKIAVHESARRLGIATALMRDCTTFALSRNVRTLSLEVRKSNLSAQAFYARLNFLPVYTRPDYYPDGEAAVVMMAGIVA